MKQLPELTEDGPDTPEQNLPAPEYADEPASPLENLPESVSAADSRQRGSGGY
jgi:hypothetical protein